jgi:hypothetical protein
MTGWHILLCAAIFSELLIMYFIEVANRNWWRA